MVTGLFGQLFRPPNTAARLDKKNQNLTIIFLASTTWLLVSEKSFKPVLRFCIEVRHYLPTFKSDTYKSSLALKPQTADASVTNFTQLSTDCLWILKRVNDRCVAIGRKHFQVIF